MVFRRQPKGDRRRPRQDQDAGKTIITKLADETLISILEDLPTHDLLACRLAHPSLTPVATTLLSKRLGQRLYVFPSTSSLRRVLAICKHPVFGKEIEEVALVGKVLWREIERFWPGYRTEEIDEELKRDSLRPPLFGAWPPCWPEGEKSVREEDPLGKLQRTDLCGSVPRLPSDCNDGGAASALRAAYMPLFDALRQLPKLRGISFVETTTHKPGLNAPTQNEIDTRAKGATSVSKSAMVRRRADAALLFGLLSDKNIEFTHLTVTTELPFVGTIPYKLHETAATLERLVACELHLDSGWKQETGWQTFCGRLLNLTNGLQHLKIVWKPNTYIEKARDEMSLQSLLRRSNVLPKLQTLELMSPPISQDFLREEKKGPSRPLCLLFDMEWFLHVHSRTLTHVKFENVTFIDTASDASFVPSIRSVLDTLSACQQLQSVLWTVNCFAHDVRCKWGNIGRDFWHCRFDCGVYCKRDPHPDVSAELLRLMRDLGEVALDSEELDCQWDLGGHVMTRRTQMIAESDSKAVDSRV